MERTPHPALQTLSEAMDSPYFTTFMSDNFLTAQLHAWLETKTIQATPHSWCFGMVDLTVDSKGMLSPTGFEISVPEDAWNDWHFHAVASEMAKAIREQTLQLSAPEHTWREYWNHYQVQNLKNQIHYYLHSYGFSVSEDDSPKQDAEKNHHFPVVHRETKDLVGYLCIELADGNRARCYSTDLNGEPVTHTYLVGDDKPAEITSRNPKSAYRDPVIPSLNTKLEDANRRTSWAPAPNTEHDREGPMPF